MVPFFFFFIPNYFVVEQCGNIPYTTAMYIIKIFVLFKVKFSNEKESNCTQMTIPQLHFDNFYCMHFFTFIIHE